MRQRCVSKPLEPRSKTTRALDLQKSSKSVMMREKRWNWLVTMPYLAREERLEVVWGNLIKGNGKAQRLSYRTVRRGGGNHRGRWEKR